MCATSKNFEHSKQPSARESCLFSEMNELNIGNGRSEVSCRMAENSARETVVCVMFLILERQQF